MTDFRKEMASVSEKALKVVNEIANPRWAIPFLGRRLNAACKDKFINADTKGFKLELPWEGQVKHESHNAYDDSTYVHELVVEVYPEGPAAGRIKSVHAHHREYWHTSSNWQDHSESATWEKRDPNDKEISQYRELLEGWTEGGSSELVQSLCHALMAIVRAQGGRIKVELGDRSEGNRPSYTALSISFSRNESSSPINIDINLDHVVEALDYSRIWLFAVFSGGVISGCVFYYGRRGRDRKERKVPVCPAATRNTWPIIRFRAHSLLFDFNSAPMVDGREA